MSVKLFSPETQPPAACFFLNSSRHGSEEKHVFQLQNKIHSSLFDRFINLHSSIKEGRRVVKNRLLSVDVRQNYD